MPKVSIVIPFHNREDLLSQALDSVQSQTFTDWEFIVLDDDHSTDSSLAISEDYANKDKRFRVVSLPNL